jgi:hypothetical protein
MKSAFALCLILAFSVAPVPAAAKEFRPYWGMQWVVTPDARPLGTLVVKEGDTITEAPMLTEDLFETSSPIVVAGKIILDKNSQLATAISSQQVRCSVSRGADATLSYTRRICLTDDDRDGQYDHYFDVGLGQGGFDVQFTGCIPPDRVAISPAKMTSVDPATLRDPMKFRVKLSKISGKKVRAKDGSLLSVENPSYEFGGSVGRNDRLWNYYSFCLQGSCRVPLGMTMSVKVEGIALRVLRQDGDRAVVEVLRNLSKRNYWDMTRGKRPASLYCPGTLFVKTDEETF